MSTHLKHYHGLQAKFIPATNTKGSRVKIISLRHNKSKIISYDYKYDNTKEIAVAYLEAQGVKICGFIAPETTALNHSYILFTDNFEFMGA
jgi:hypothetical protein